MIGLFALSNDRENRESSKHTVFTDFSLTSYLSYVFPIQLAMYDMKIIDLEWNIIEAYTGHDRDSM